MRVADCSLAEAYGNPCFRSLYQRLRSLTPRRRAARAFTCRVGSRVALEPDLHEHKFYASGVGNVLETDEDTGARTELIRVKTGQ